MFDHDDTRSDYECYTDRLKDRIHELRLLRDAQADGSAQQHTFQQEINNLTREYLAWRDATPQLEDLDGQIAQARNRVSAENRKASDTTDNLWQVAKTSVFGVLSLLLAVWLNPHWLVWLVALVFIASSVGAVLHGTRTRAQRYAAVENADDEVTVLLQRRRLVVAGVQSPELDPMAYGDRPLPNVPEQEQRRPDQDEPPPRLALVPGPQAEDGEVVDAELLE